MKHVARSLQFTLQTLPVHMDQVHPLVAPTHSCVHVDKVSSDKDCHTTAMKRLVSSLKKLLTHNSNVAQTLLHNTKMHNLNNTIADVCRSRSKTT